MRQASVLLIEDEKDKRENIEEEIRSFLGENTTFECAETFAEATKCLYQDSYDLIVFDLLLPRRQGEEPSDIAEEFREHLIGSEKNALATVVGISRYPEVIQARQGGLAKSDILVISYEDEDQWRPCLRLCLQRVAAKTFYDFVIVCALDHERSAFEGVTREDFRYGELAMVHGLDARELEIGGLKGVCVLQPQMGLVDAAITTSQALSAFNPRLVCMAGICGGFEDEVAIGTLVVSGHTWEHQAGKWKGDNFELRSYQEGLDEPVRVKLNQMIEKDKTLKRLASKDHEIQVPHEVAGIHPTVSGSAVIASNRYKELIQEQHGKVAAVDMEVFGLYRAVALSGRSLSCFAAKTVVDHANEEKSDDHQKAGAILSARFVVEAIAELLK